MLDDLTKGIVDALGLEVDDDKDETQENVIDQEDVIDETTDDDDDKDSDTDDKGSDDDKEDGDDNPDETADKSDKKVLLDSEDDAEPATVDFDSQLSEKSGGRFKTFEDVEAALSETTEQSFANDTIAKLNEYVEAGGDINTFLKTQTADYSKISDLDAIREVEGMSDSTLSRDEIELLIEEEYGVSEDASDREKALARIKLKRAGEAARKQLTDHQKKWAVPQASNEEKLAAAREQAEKWKVELAEAVKGNEEVSFKIGEGEFKFKPSDEVKKAVSDGHDLTKFWDRYSTEDGYDINKFVKDMYILNNYEDVVKAAVTYGKGLGTEDVVDGLKNPDYKGSDKKGKGGGTKSVADQIAENLFG